MPTITIAIDPTFEEKKEQLIEKLTNEAARITGYPTDFFYFYIQEYPAENIGVAGRTIKKIKNQK